MSLFHRWWIKNPIFFCCLVSFYWLNLQRQTDINKRWRRTNTQGWKQQQQQKTLYTPKVCVEEPGIKKTWKIPVVYLKARASPFIAALIRVTHADPGREQNNKKKRNSSHSWLTALINKREDGGVGGEDVGALCISSCSLWGKNCDNRKMPENNTWLSKLIIYSPCACVYVRPCFLMRIFQMKPQSRTRLWDGAAWNVLSRKSARRYVSVSVCEGFTHTLKHCLAMDWQLLLSISISNKLVSERRFKKMWDLTTMV